VKGRACLIIKRVWIKAPFFDKWIGFSCGNYPAFRRSWNGRRTPDFRGHTTSKSFQKDWAHTVFELATILPHQYWRKVTKGTYFQSRKQLLKTHGSPWLLLSPESLFWPTNSVVWPEECKCILVYTQFTRDLDICCAGNCLITGRDQRKWG